MSGSGFVKDDKLLLDVQSFCSDFWRIPIVLEGKDAIKTAAR
jgi:hypothetical protein